MAACTSNARTQNVSKIVRRTKLNNESLNNILQYIFPRTKLGLSADRHAELNFSNLSNYLSENLGALPLSRATSPTNSRTASSTTTTSGHKGGYMKVLFGEKKQKFVHTPALNDDNQSIMEGKLGAGQEVGLQSHPLDNVPGDNLAVIGNTNFQSVRASHCVYKGKWQYEVLLGTPGLMQVGWCTPTCKFNREEGVGDTRNSFAYDGYREAKWTARASTKYGQAWEADDIVTCLLDLDERKVSFMLNGEDLGVAFEGIPTGPGVAYFPGASLAYKEVAHFNFGLRPFKYPVAPYRPIQKPPGDSPDAGYLVACLSRVSALRGDRPELAKLLDPMSRQIIVAVILQRLGPLLKSPYNVECHLLPFLHSVCLGCRDDAFGDLHRVLSSLFQYSEPKEARDCVTNVFSSVLRCHRSAPVHASFAEQRRNLRFVLALLRHPQTRRVVDLHGSFDRQSEIPSLFHIKQVSKHRDSGLRELIPIVWGQNRDPKATYEKGYELLKTKMEVIKEIQRDIMRLMVLDSQAEGNEISISFAKKFRKYLEQIVSTNRPDYRMVCPPIVLHSFMQRLLDIVREQWDKLASNKTHYVPADEGYIPSELFYTESIEYFDLQRVGGLKSHLFNEHKDELAKEGVSVMRGRGSRRGEDWHEHNAILQLFDEDHAGTSLSTLTRADDDADLDSFNPVLRLARALLSQSNKMSGRDKNLTVSRKRSEEGDFPTKIQLLELTDGCLLLYTNLVHQHMDKIHSTRTKIVEYATSLSGIEIKLKQCENTQLTEVRESLEQSHAILLRHMTELCRAIAWLKASVYAPGSQQNLWWLFQVCVRTVHKASNKGVLFTFMPEFFLTAGARLYKCLREYFSPSQPFELLPDLQGTLVSFVHFLSLFHCDSRVINNDVKTMLANTITTFITFPLQLQAIEAMPKEHLHTFVRNMLYAYDEDKPWTSVGHRILAILWRGSGFAMRFDHPPYVAKVKKLLGRENDPYVPEKLLSFVSELLSSESGLAGKFVHSILEHLNWSFSEFIGQLQEVQQQNAKGWNNNSGLLASLDAQALRQLRIVDMLFELSVSLMRVLELTVSLAPSVFLDWDKRETSETLVTGLVQCINQILNRVTKKDNLFDKIVSGKQPGFSGVHHYPLMTATSGILIKLVNQQRSKWSTRAVTTLLSDPGFDVTSAEFLLDMKSGKSPEPRGQTIPYTRSKNRKFVSLQDYEEVMDGEVETLLQLILKLRNEVKLKEDNVGPMDEDNLCTICYDNISSVVFEPCKHSSCRTCIKRQLLGSKECFYCKTTVEYYRDATAPSDGDEMVTSAPLDGAQPSTSF